MFAVMIGTLFQVGMVFAADPFDGEWKGTSRGKGGCRTEEMTMVITDGKITGHRDIPAMGSTNFGGKITSDGTITGAGGRLKGNASGDTAAVTFHTDSKECGDIDFPLKKAK